MNQALRIFATATFLIGAPSVLAQSQSNGGQDDPITVRGQRYENRVVCRYEAPTGSRFLERMCQTNKEWDTMREANIRMAHEAIDSPKINCVGC